VEQYPEECPVDGTQVKEGNRNTWLFNYGRKYAYTLTGNRYPHVLAYISEANIKYCCPPLPDKEVNSIAKSISKGTWTDESRELARRNKVENNRNKVLAAIKEYILKNRIYPRAKVVHEKSGISIKTVRKYMSPQNKLLG
jgi:hypothetical protein